MSACSASMSSGIAFSDDPSSGRSFSSPVNASASLFFRLLSQSHPLPPLPTFPSWQVRDRMDDWEKEPHLTESESMRKMQRNLLTSRHAAIGHIAICIHCGSEILSGPGTYGCPETWA